MKTIFTLAATLLLAASPSLAAGFPGFRIELLGEASGFLTSLVVDSRGTVYYSSQEGGIYRFENGRSTRVAKVTGGIGMSDTGVLGMALIDDQTAAVHYTLPASDPQLVTDDVVALVDLATGAETVLRKFVCDVEVPGRGTSMLHHGGNPIVAPDGSIFVGIGEYGGRSIAQLPNWNGGKIWRVYQDGGAEQYAVGLRNPFDFVWDEARQVMIIPDNGDEGSDELHVVSKGANCAYPIASANQPHPPGMSTPAYVWTPTISPCGTIALNGANDQLRSGIVIVGYVSKGVHYIPDIDVRPLPDPLVVLDASAENAELVDVAEAPDGTIYLADLFRIYRLITPQRGDCDGDGALTTADITALRLELKDAPEKRIDAQRGAYAGSWGCDANGDDTIDSADMAAMAGILGRRRVVRAGGR